MQMNDDNVMGSNKRLAAIFMEIERLRTLMRDDVADHRADAAEQRKEIEALYKAAMMAACEVGEAGLIASKLLLGYGAAKTRLDDTVREYRAHLSELIKRINTQQNRMREEVYHAGQTELQLGGGA